MADDRNEPSKQEGGRPLGSTIRDQLSRGLQERQGEEGERKDQLKMPPVSQWKSPSHPALGGRSRKEIVAFCEELSLLLECGMPLLRALQTLQGRWHKASFRRIIGDIAGAVESGRTFSQACAEYGRGFPVPVLSMIYAGERSGELPKMLAHIAARGQKVMSIRRRALGTLIYPAFVILIALLVIGFVFGMLAQGFDFFKNISGQELPPTMRALLKIGEWFRTPAVWIGIVVVLVGLYVLYKLAMMSHALRMLRDRFLVHMPGLSHFVKQGLLEQFSRVFGTLLGSGVPLQESLQASHDTARNEVLRSCLRDTAEAVSRGERVTETLRKANCFPLLAYDMCGVGEEAGMLDRVFDRLADRYEEKLAAETDLIGKFVQPLMIIFLALLVGFIVFAFFSMYTSTLGAIH